MKKLLTLVMLLLSVTSFAHVWEVRVSQAQNGTLTWYLQSYHSVNECGIGNSGLVINGIQYPIQQIFPGSSPLGTSSLFAVTPSFNNPANRQSYATITTPFLGTTLSVFPYSNNVCWDNLVSGTGTFTPPPPPVCTTCPLTGASNTTGTASNNGTPCDPTDDILPATLTVNHLSCGSITGDGKFTVVFNNTTYGPFNYSTGITTNVSLNLPYGTSNSSTVSIVDGDFPCSISHSLTVPGGQFNGVGETIPPVISCPSNITVNAGANECSATATFAATVTDNCGGTPTLSYSQNSGSSFALGTTTVNVTATDAAGNSSNCSFTVTVVDVTAPTITCPSNITVTAADGACNAAVNFAAPAVTDNCGSCVNVPASIPGYSLLGTFGGHTYFRSNSAGNWNDINAFALSIGGHLATIGSAAENNFLSGVGTSWIGFSDAASEGNFVWSNGEPVVFTFWCGGEPNNSGDEDYTMINWGGNGCWNDGHATSIIPGIIEFDCTTQNAISLSQTGGLASGSTFPEGTTTVTYAATDAAGNTSTCSFDVTVLPSPNNTVSIGVTPSNNTYTGGVATNIYLGYGPQSATLTATATGGSGFTYSWSPSTNLNCSNCQSPVFTPTAAGTYTYTVTSTNSNGCTATSSVTFCVVDAKAPSNGNNPKVYICHNGNTLSVSVNAVAAHLANHGDGLGSCGSGCTANKGGDQHEEEAMHELTADFNIYPNPSTGIFTLELVEAGEVSYLVTDVTGKVVAQQTITDNDQQQLQINLTGHAAGVYMIKVVNANKVFQSRITLQ